MLLELLEIELLPLPLEIVCDVISDGPDILLPSLFENYWLPPISKLFLRRNLSFLILRFLSPLVCLRFLLIGVKTFLSWLLLLITLLLFIFLGFFYFKIGKL